MAIPAVITDESTGATAKVVMGAALAVEAPFPSDPYNAILAVDDQVYNIVPAVANKQFCITGIILTATSSVSNTTPATVVVYEASSADTSTQDKEIMTIPMLRNTARDFIGVSLLAGTAKYINATTTDDDIFITMLGYYV